MIPHVHFAYLAEQIKELIREVAPDIPVK